MTTQALTALILTGGQGSRLGGRDKGLVVYDGRRLIDIALAHLEGRCDEILISANRHLDIYAQTGRRVVADTRADYPGPLAGIEAALGVVNTPLLLLLPVDCPHPPRDWPSRLCAALDENPAAGLAVPQDGERLQPLFALLRTRIAPSLTRFLDAGERRVQAWVREQAPVTVDFSDQPDAFTNINTPQDLAGHD